MSNKAKTLLNLYNRGKVTIEGLKKAVEDGTITNAEYQEIIGNIY